MKPRPYSPSDPGLLSVPIPLNNPLASGDYSGDNSSGRQVWLKSYDLKTGNYVASHGNPNATVERWYCTLTGQDNADQWAADAGLPELGAGPPNEWAEPRVACRRLRIPRYVARDATPDLRADGAVIARDGDLPVLKTDPANFLDQVLLTRRPGPTARASSTASSRTPATVSSSRVSSGRTTTTT